MIQNIVIAVFLIVILFFALKSTVKHFKGESSCCGGKTYKAKPRKLKNPVISEKTFIVSNMKCQNCANRITEAIHSVEGTSAKIKLNEKKAIISTDRKIDWNDVKTAIEKAGYSAEILEK